MNRDDSEPQRGRLTTLFLFAVVTLAVVGYIVGLSDGVPQSDEPRDAGPIAAMDQPGAKSSDKTIAAVSYWEIPSAAMGPTIGFQSKTVSLPIDTAYDPYQKIVPDEAEKAQSAKVRSSRRAYNGAPPIIPHAVENTSDAACYACHNGGLKLGEMKASVMSHQYLANCNQCHASPPPSPFQEQAVASDSDWVANHFVGLAAPRAGKRAFPGAPPTIPHSQWMRENCNACHGGPNGWAGMESSHPWRTNCTQCHAPSARLDQAIPAETIPMLPPLAVTEL